MSRYISLSIGSETGETDNLRVATYRLGPPLSAASKKAERSKRNEKTPGSPSGVASPKLNGQ